MSVFTGAVWCRKGTVMLIKIRRLLITLVQFLLNPHFLICYLLAWLVTNGWSYILFGAGIFLNIPWMTAIASAYLAFLWLPVSPEKIVTVAIAMFLLKEFFPNDEKTLGILRQLHAKVKEKITRKKEK